MGRIVLPPSDVKLMSCYFHCAGYFRVIADINSTHKDALGTLLKDCVNEINGHMPNFYTRPSFAQVMLLGQSAHGGVGQSAHNWVLCPHTIGDFPLV